MNLFFYFEPKSEFIYEV